MPLRLYNTLTQTKEPFRTVEPGKVRMYVCGPTVYSESHIGHMVGPVIFDTLKRFLVYSGYEVNWAVNITDIDDKLIDASLKTGKPVKEIAEAVTADYLACLQALNVTGIDRMPRATEFIPQIIAMIQRLVDGGHAYPSKGDVYFDVTTFADYGKLSHRDPEELQAGARIEPSSVKRHPGDFALWKGSKPGEPAWESPWGPGRPGWHIECSAMSQGLFGDQLDIHGGGLDLVFPHHENEIAQSEAAAEKAPFSTFWLHNGLLTKDGRKISKSDPETIVLMNELLTRFEPDAIRGLLLMSHYRRPTDYGNARIEEVSRGLQAFRNFFDRAERIAGDSFYALPAPTAKSEFDAGNSEFLREVAVHRGRFVEALEDDFNTGGAFGELFELLRTLNRFADAKGLDAPGRSGADLGEFRKAIALLRELTGLLGLFAAAPKRAEVGDNLTGQLMQLLIDLRAQLRKEKQYAMADTIRKRLDELKVTLEDGPNGTRWRVEP
jgi:cysteinyl-tRNA synthetase